MEAPELLELLGSLESLEDPLLSWGVVDGGLSDEELRRCVRDWGLKHAPFEEVDDLVRALLEHGSRLPRRFH